MWDVALSSGLRVGALGILVPVGTSKVRMPLTICLLCCCLILICGELLCLSLTGLCVLALPVAGNFLMLHFVPFLICPM
jgi:hypothetical protein